MSEWRQTSLGDVCELKRGYDLPKAGRRDGTVPIVSSSGPTGFHDEAKVKAPGVVTGRYGTLGDVFFLEDDFWPLNTSLYVRDFKGNNARFVAELLRNMNLAQFDGAAAVPGLNRNQLHTVEVWVPDIETQRAVASVAQALDGLVENNRRRVEVLEEMARAIYREWFVKFRYPGHEDVPLVDSALGPMPDGWSARRSGQLVVRGVLEVGDGYRAKNAEMTKAEGLAFLRVGNVRDGYLDISEADHLPLPYQERLGPKVSRVGDTVLCMKGTVGRSARVTSQDKPVAYSPQVSYWRTLDSKILPSTFLHELLRSESFKMQAFAAKGSTAMADYVNLRDQRNMTFLLPPAAIVQSFDEILGPLHGLADSLRSTSARLSQMRDALLPKLVTGQIDVSTLDFENLNWTGSTSKATAAL